MVGSLNWLVQGTRPDLAFYMVDLSTRLNSGKVKDFLQVCRILNKAKDNKADIFFPHLGNSEFWHFIVFANASHANLSNNTGSCIGYIVFLAGENNSACPLMWRSGKAKRVVKSTIAAEAMALLEGVEEAIYLRSVLLHLWSLPSQAVPITCFTDHKGLLESLFSTKLVEDRRLRIEIAVMKQCIERKDINQVKKVSSSQQLADCLTKRGVDGNKLLTILQQGRLDLDLL
jgi:hypothetical protein